MPLSFKAKIYKIGINAVADVPQRVTSKLVPTAGRIKITGTINGFRFKTTLMPVKNGLHLLYVNMIALKGGETALGKTAAFIIRQDTSRPVEESFPMHHALRKELAAKNLLRDFDALSLARRKDILKYLHKVKAEETLKRNINSVTLQLEHKQTNVRIPLPLNKQQAMQ